MIKHRSLNRFLRVTLSTGIAMVVTMPSFVVVCICPENDAVLASRFHAGPACGVDSHEALHFEESGSSHEDEHSHCQKQCRDVPVISGEFNRQRAKPVQIIDKLDCLDFAPDSQHSRSLLSKHFLTEAADSGIPPPALLRTVILLV